MARATVLIAEDDLKVQRGLQKMLFNQGEFEVGTADDGNEAWEKAQAMKPDLIVSDYEMPGMNGFDLCRRVKADPQLGGSMFVVLTGFTDTNLKVSGLNLGVDDYLTKPVEAVEFLAKIRATLRIKELHDQLRAEKTQLHQLHTQLGESFGHLVKILIHLLDLKIPGCSSRGEFVALKSAEVAGAMRVPDHLLQDLDTAARLLEIGRLVDEHHERPGASPQGHAFLFLVTSKAILDQIAHFGGAAEIVGAVGEHWDGTGVPGRLSKGQIPLRSRIVRVLFDYAVMIEPRTEGSLAPTEAAERLERFAGTRYDPLVVAHVQRALADATEAPTQRQRLALQQLEVGMELAEDLVTSSGVKLLARGSRITTTTLELILRRHTSDPVLYGAWITG